MSSSDPQPFPGKPRPRRAEPLQPDKPGQGDQAEHGGAADPDAEDPDQKRQEQERTARENVREGYK